MVNADRGALAHFLLEAQGGAGPRRPANPAVGDGSTVAPDPGDGVFGMLALLGLPAVIAGREPGPWLALARGVAPLLALVSSWERLLLDPAARDLDAAILSPVVATAIAGPARERVLLSWAGDRRSRMRRAELRNRFAEPEVRDGLRDSFHAGMTAAKNALTRETETIATPLLSVIAGVFAELDLLASLRSPAPAARPKPWPASGPGTGDTPLGGIALDVARAVERIARDPSWSSSTDVQRWGVHPLTGDLVADWFPRGLVELGLRRITDRSRSIRALLEEIPPGELRYYRDWRGIPPDADSLGLMLRLAAGIADAPRERIESWLSVMEENLGADCLPPVWFHLGPGGLTHEPDRAWDGGDCTACLLSLSLGLAEYAPARFDRVVAAILGLTLDRFRGDGFAGVFHYARDFAAPLYAGLVTRLEALPGEGLPATRELLAEARRACDDLMRSILAAQRLDGSWGSPQSTAWNVEALCLARPVIPPLLRAARYLSETQRGDGGWLAELVYFTVGKPGYMVEYRGIEVTTATCASALFRVLAMSGAIPAG